VWTLLGEPDGSFHLARLHPVDAANASLAVADVNGDGKPDVVLAYAGTSDAPESQVAVLPGNGAGAFGPAQAYPVGQRPYAVAVADVNGDGHPDLITADAGTSHAHGDTLLVLLNNRDGTFQPAQTVATGTYPDAVAVTDLNGDGLPDLVNANQYGHDEVGQPVTVEVGHGDRVGVGPSGHGLRGLEGAVAVIQEDQQRIAVGVRSPRVGGDEIGMAVAVDVGDRHG